VEGDARGPSDVLEASEGCTSVTHGVNYPLHQWNPAMVQVTQNAKEAAEYRGATLLFPANLFGCKLIYEVPLPAPPPRVDFNDPPSKKGALRNLLEDLLATEATLPAADAGGPHPAASRPPSPASGRGDGSDGPPVILVRSGDYFGPGVDNGFTRPTFLAALDGGAIPWLGRRDARHAFTFIDDVAAVAVEALLSAPTGMVHLNVASTLVTDAGGWAAALGAAADRPAPRVRHLPDWALIAASPFHPLLRELVELRWHWHGPMLLDDSSTRARLPAFRPTDPAEALRATLDWWKTAR
jgi:hypothetical protein